MDDLAEGMLRLVLRAVLFAVRVLFEILVQEIFNTLFYWTARIVLPVATLGQVRVASRSTKRPAHQSPPYSPGLSPVVATLVGIGIWFVVIVAAIVIASCFGDAPPPTA